MIPADLSTIHSLPEMAIIKQNVGPVVFEWGNIGRISGPGCITLSSNQGRRNVREVKLLNHTDFKISFASTALIKLIINESPFQHELWGDSTIHAYCLKNYPQFLCFSFSVVFFWRLI